MTDYWARNGEEISEYTLDGMYADMIDETNEDVMICGLAYNPSRVLMHVDPIAYRVGFSDWLDSEISEGNVLEEDPYPEDDTRTPEEKLLWEIFGDADKNK